MCTTQLVKLQRRLPEPAAAGAAVLAVSTDPPEQARQVVEQFHLSFPVLSDPRMEVIRPYGMKGDGMEMADLGYVVIDRDGRIRSRPIDPEFGEHVELLLHEVRLAATRE